MDEMVEARAEEMTNQEPEAPAEDADEPEEVVEETVVEETVAEETIEEPQEETPEESVEEEVAETSEEPATWNADVDPWADN
jgi:hypothetical protein